jgi:hypothetical protein
MGRQLHFHMLEEDVSEFFRVVEAGGQVTVVARDSNSAAVLPVGARDVDSGNTVCFWNRSFLPQLERKWIPDPGYYRIDSLKLPVLEFMPSFKANWEGKPALGQGRLFGNFEPYLGKPREFTEWYELLASWIRRRYRKSPVGLGGFVGPEAYEFYRNGGFLLPNIVPPRTEEWIAKIDNQHAVQEL